MLTKYALVAIIVLCCTVLGFTLMVGDSLCELSIRERGMGNDSNLLIVFYVQIMPDDFVMQLHRF